MPKSNKAAVLILLFTPCFIAGFAQTNSTYSIGFNLGTFIYQGDLSPWRSGSLKTPSFVIGITGGKRVSDNFAARLDVNFGGLKGDESKYLTPEFRQHRAFAFKSRVTEVVASAVYHPIGSDRKLSPYIVGGLGYSFLKIRRDYSRFNAEYFSSEPKVLEGLRTDIATSLPRGSFVVPVGLGLQTSLSQRVSLNTEASYRIMSNDYLDGFSKAANPDRGDHYYKYSVGLVFNLGVKDKYSCPVMKY